MKDIARIMIVDDHALYRDGLKFFIEIEELGKVIAEADNGQSFLNMLDNLKPDLVLMDVEMPIMDGIDATRKALELKPDLKIVGLSVFNGKQNCIDMMNAGAIGFVLKTVGILELKNAIAKAIDFVKPLSAT